MDIVIRDVQNNERQQMLALILNSYKEYKEESSPEFWEQYTRNITDAVRSGPDIERIAAFNGVEMVGSVLLCHKTFKGSDPEIRLLAVSPNARQQGIAQKLMTECERRVRQLGKKRVVLHTTHLMQIAKAMYERSNYVRFEEIDFRPVPDFLVMGFAKELN
ncbi:MAG TPA: GNAT family N-acetyltransferase [Oculatellaceae cyanobacterium]